MAEFSIGEVARRTGSSRQLIRWYEEQGLLPPPRRTQGGQRRYDEAALNRILFIRHARDLGFSLQDIRALLELAAHPEAPCAHADDIARRQLANVRAKIAELRALEKELLRMVSECPSGEVRRCRVIEVISDHAQCRFHGRSTGNNSAA
jgi:DNA-binding transcriptional MerR regulator